jgi:hypothetical protein
VACGVTTRVVAMVFRDCTSKYHRSLFNETKARVSIAADKEDRASPLEEFLSGPAPDPETLGDPPLQDGEDPLLTRDRVEIESDEE